MGPVIGEILPYAIGVAISPVPIVAVILMLFSERARQNGPAFLGGWVVGLTTVVVVVMLIAGASDQAKGPTTLGALINLGLGILLIVLGVAEWIRRPAAGETSPMPGWMTTIDAIQPGRAFWLGALLSSVNPKNLALGVGAAIAISQGALSLGGQVLSVILFVLVASVSIIVPVVYSLVGGAAARTRLDGWKRWLGENNATVMAVLLLVIGVVLFGKGIGALIG
jgi:threonine/homoserine/homoserine lactone efflux protein